MASMKESSTKSQLLNLETCVSWIKRLLVINSGLWASWPISFFYDFFWFLSCLIYSMLNSHYSDLLLDLLFFYYNQQEDAVYSQKTPSRYNSQDIFKQLSWEEEILSKILWYQVFKLNSLLRYLKIFLILLTTWMCGKPLYFSVATSSPGIKTLVHF